MTMQRINTHGPGGPDVLYLETTTIPQPQAGEILIKTAYAGLNRPDILQRRGLYPVPEGVTRGRERFSNRRASLRAD